MAGIYIHVPFCKQACHYCDFHFSTNFRNQDQLIEALLQELDLRGNYLAGENIDTIYFGGGTPSAVDTRHIDQIIRKIFQDFNVNDNPEITLEANPDDLTEEKISDWVQSGVNRLSVGVQSFYDHHLQAMNRAHNSMEAKRGLQLAQKLGITNISMDLIYGIPGMTMDEWKRNVDTFFDLELPHLSAYGLTIEEGTHFGHLALHKKLKPSADGEYNLQFEWLMNQAELKGFDHYEISNFSKPGMLSRHNTSYWKEVKYLGIGPSAHSYDGRNRQWNVSSNAKYIQGILSGEILGEVEELSVRDAYNEYILTHLRTKWGLDLDQIKNKFGDEFRNNVEVGMLPYLADSDVQLSQGRYVLTRSGKFIADKISSDLFVVA